MRHPFSRSDEDEEMTGSTYEHPAARTPPPRRSMHDVRAAAQLARARPAYAAGFRAGIASVVPLLADKAFGIGGGTWMSLAGLNGALIDRGGPYRARAIVLSAAALVSALAVLIATLLAGHPVWAVPATFAVATLCGLMRVWPDVGPAFGVTTLITYVIALAIPAPTPVAALMRAGYIAIGGLWAMLIAIVLWPLRPYRPVRLSVAACYLAIADYLDDAIGASGPRAPSDPWVFKSHLVLVREALETARTALATTRRGRAAETRRGERLLILHELADQLYAHVIALAEIVEGARGTSIPQAARAELAKVGAAAASMLRGLAEGIESERDLPRLSASWSGDAIRASSPDGPPEPNRLQIATLVDRIAEYADLAAAFTATLSSGDPVPDVDERVVVDASRRRERVILSISALMRPDSVVLQHALRIGLVTTVAVFVTSMLRLNHGYWVTLTAVVIMQPYGSATRQKAFQRVAGTIIGAAVAAVLSAIFGGTGVIVVLIFLFTALCVSLLPLNYGAYAIFGTPAFVLLAEAKRGELASRVAACDEHADRRHTGARRLAPLAGGRMDAAAAARHRRASRECRVLAQRRADRARQRSRGIRHVTRRSSNDRARGDECRRLLPASDRRACRTLRGARADHGGVGLHAASRGGDCRTRAGERAGRARPGHRPNRRLDGPCTRRSRGIRRGPPSAVAAAHPAGAPTAGAAAPNRSPGQAAARCCRALGGVRPRSPAKLRSRR